MMFNSKLIIRLLLCIYVMCSFSVCAQTIPVEGDTLNYRLVGFVVPEHNKYKNYILDVAEGGIYNKVDFAKNIVVTKTFSSNRIVATVPSFNKEYTWRISYINAKNEIKEYGELHHFVTGYNNYIDTNKYRQRIIKQDYTNKDLLIFFDGTRSLNDIDGNPLWYIPDIPGVIDHTTIIRDLKISAAGTITFLANTNACEMNYDGDVLWKAPNDGVVSNDTSEYYHHEFTRLNSGNYMIAANERKDTSAANVTTNFCGTLIEYDVTGKVRWFWKSYDYFKTAGFVNPLTEKPTTNPRNHLNAFYFDEASKHIYISFKDQSKILKIDYPSGKVLASYGKSNNAANNSDVMFYTAIKFHGQHACHITNNGALLFYNNNTPIKGTRDKDRKNVSQILLIKQPSQPKDTPVINWEFKCDIDTLANSFSEGQGNVTELKDASYLTSMGTTNRVFIVSSKKRVLLNIISETYDTGLWAPLPNYRVSPIDDPRLLNALIFQRKQ